MRSEKELQLFLRMHWKPGWGGDSKLGDPDLTQQDPCVWGAGRPQSRLLAEIVQTGDNGEQDQVGGSKRRGGTCVYDVEDGFLYTRSI